MSQPTTGKYCFQLQVKPDHIQAYSLAHAAVWPDMLAALHAAGYRNYSIFMRDDGLVIGYFETDDLEACQTGMAAAEVNARWQGAMAEHFVGLDVPADQAFGYLAPVFNLEDQLSRV
ncbi:MAG: L-rhamnose 1-epimerase [Glaciihabitans sp.]|nr:L-rhamnose 1-epimerase [Glaciihabitans sp.]